MVKVGMKLVVSRDNVWESPCAMGWVIILYDRLIQARCCLKRLRQNSTWLLSLLSFPW